MIRRTRKTTRVLTLSLALAVGVSLIVLAPLSSGAPSGAGDPMYYFRGYGRAHGVGMCMDGVYYRAKEGQDYHTILNYYYTGITFTRTDENRPVRVKGRDGQIRVLSMGDYLHHLQEEPDNYPLEELKALYVAARTYTLSCIARGKHAAQGFDICSSGECCQAFDENKTVANYPNNNAAVDATAGEIMTYNGQPITAAYCGSCGGHTENNEDVWGGSPIPYLRGKPDDYCKYSPRFAWSAQFTKADLEARLNSRSDTAVGSLYVMDLSNRTPGGRVKTARLVGSSAVKTVSGSVIQALLGFSNTKFDMVRPNFDEYILVLNPNAEAAIVTFTFMKPDGTTTDQIEQVGPKARFTLKVNDYVQFQEASTRVVADRPVICERAMYFNYRGRFDGGSGTIGVTAPRKKWYLAEGYTAQTFETYVLVQNPGPNPADIKYTFLRPKGQAPVVKTLQVPAYSRTTLCLDDVPGLEATDVSTVVECTSGDGIVAERSMYFDYEGKTGGHTAIAVGSPASNWYLAEGYTGGTFDTYILLQNPTDKTVAVDASYLKESGAVIRQTYSLAANSRYTVHADAIRGLENAGFSTTLSNKDGAGFIAERAMYFDYDSSGITGGSDSAGVNAPATTWYLAEGYTGGSFAEYILLANPDSKAASVKVTYNTPAGASIEKTYPVRAHSRYTILVDAIDGLSNTEVSATVKSTNGVGVMAERAMYFVYTDGYSARNGGHDSVGATAPSQTWYFAEGYTGF
jgi:SpoIID/LytB domain protein